MIADPIPALLESGELDVHLLLASGELRTCRVAVQPLGCATTASYTLGASTWAAEGAVTGYVDADEIPDVIAVSADGVVHFRDGADVSRAAAPDVIITHRLAILSLADRIVAMQAGRIVDVGTHREMIDRCGLYRRLHQIQFEDVRRAA